MCKISSPQEKSTFCSSLVHLGRNTTSDCTSRRVFAAPGAVSTPLLTELLAGPSFAWKAGTCAKITFSHAPEEEQAASAEPFFPLMKLRQRPLSCSLSAAGEMCVLSPSKLSGGSWTSLDPQHNERQTGVLMKIKALMFTE